MNIIHLNKNNYFSFKRLMEKKSESPSTKKEKLIFSKSQDNCQKVKKSFSIISILPIIFFLSLIIISIIIIKEFININPNKMKEKELIIFDFDTTLTVKDTFNEQRFIFENETIRNELYQEILASDNWTTLFINTYEKLKKFNYTIDIINKFLSQLPFNKGMIELLSYLKNKKNKYEIIILSGGHSYQIKYMLKNSKIDDVFDDILTNPSYVDDEGKIVVKQGHYHTCDICNKAQCKKQEYTIYIDRMKNERKLKFSKTYFICDGKNDFCLARYLQKKDTLLVRKNFGLYKKLYENKTIDKIKCNVSEWNDGFDLLDYFKKINN